MVSVVLIEIGGRVDIKFFDSKQKAESYAKAQSNPKGPNRRVKVIP